LGHELDSLGIVLVNQLSEVSTDNILLDSEFVLTDIWNLKKHGSGHEDAIKYFKIDLKVWWDESLLLLELLLKGLLLVLGVGVNSLGERLLQLWTLANWFEDLEALVKETGSEGGETDLDNGSVEADLVRDLLLTDGLLQLGLHYQVLSHGVSVVDGVVINLE